MNGKSRKELFEFLDYLEDKGLMPAATVQTRRAGVKKVLGILSDDEADDVTSIDLGDVATRFANIHGKNYTTASLKSYVSRVKSAIEDFDRYISDPLNFKVSGRAASRKSNDSTTTTTSGIADKNRKSEAGASVQAPFRAVANTILPIQIREDRVVQIQGLPYDLTESEARKIANVITAMVL